MSRSQELIYTPKILHTPTFNFLFVLFYTPPRITIYILATQKSNSVIIKNKRERYGEQNRKRLPNRPPSPATRCVHRNQPFQPWNHHQTETPFFAVWCSSRSRFQNHRIAGNNWQFNRIVFDFFSNI